MKTNIIVYCSSEGAKPSEVVAKFKAKGFEPGLGRYDFSHTWEGSPSVAEVVKLLDDMTEALKGTNIRFKVETTE